MPTTLTDADIDRMSAQQAPRTLTDADIDRLAGRQSATPQGSAASRFGSGLYDATVGPLVETAKALKEHPIDTIASMAKSLSGFDDLHQVVNLVRDGKYGQAALKFVDIGQKGPARADAVIEPIASDVRSGDYAHAAGRAVGTAAMVAAPEAAETEAGQTAITATKGALKGAAKTAANPKTWLGVPLAEVAGEMAGVPRGATAGTIAGGRIIGGAIEGGKAALAERAAAAASPAAAAETTLLEDLAQSQTGKSFARLSASQQDAVRALASKVKLADAAAAKAPAVPSGSAASAATETAPAAVLRTPTPDVSNAGYNAEAQAYQQFAEQQRADVLSGANRQPLRPPIAQPAPPKFTPVRPPLRDPSRSLPGAPQFAAQNPAAASIAEQLRDELVAGGMKPEEMTAPAVEAPSQAGLSRIAANRAAKADKLANLLHQFKIDSATAQTMTEADWRELANAAGVKKPGIGKWIGSDTAGEALFKLRKLEAAEGRVN